MSNLPLARAQHQRAYTVPEFEDKYRIGKTKIYGEIAEGRLTAVRVGAKTLIRHDDAEIWLANLPKHLA